ncbi:MAG: hypothetical protein RPU39_15630 [Candidatus Sedimenticola sp. (ex Thyasira tokunagai)]
MNQVSYWSYEDDTGKYLMGDDVRAAKASQKTESPDSSYIRTDKYRIMALYAMKKLGAMNPRIITGLPVKFIQHDKQFLEEQIKKWDYPGGEIQSVSVVPQPIGTIVDVAYDGRGRVLYPELEGATKSIAVVDIGGGTIDMIEIVNMKPVPDRIFGLTEGLSRAHSMLGNDLTNSKKYAVGNLSPTRLGKL